MRGLPGAQPAGGVAGLGDPMSGDRAGQDLLALISQILDFSRIEAGRVEIRPEDVDVAATLRSVAGLIRPLAEQAGVEVGTEVEGEAGAA